MFLKEQRYTFAIVKNPKQGRNQEPYLYFISDLQDVRAIANHYVKRWKIECCFRHLKRNGFNIEDINLKTDIKIELMMGILACTYIIAVMQGILQQQKHPPEMKRYKNGKCYPAISVFRKGYLLMQQIFLNLMDIILYLDKRLKQPPGKNRVLIHDEKSLQNV